MRAHFPVPSRARRASIRLRDVAKVARKKVRSLLTRAPSRASSFPQRNIAMTKALSHSRPNSVALALVTIGLSILAACGGGGGDGNSGPTLVSISVSPTTPAVPVQGQRQYLATGTYDDTSTADLTAAVTWDTTDPSVATIDASGLATTEKIGTTLVH